MRRCLMLLVTPVVVSAGCGDADQCTYAVGIWPLAEPHEVGVEGREAGDYYTTGACFWDWFETTHGHDAFVAVMQMLATNRSPVGDHPGCPGLIELIEPIVGEGISAFTEERYGFGRGHGEYHRCG